MREKNPKYILLFACVSLCPSHVQAVVEALPLHGADTDALVVLENAPYAVIQRAVHAPLAVERVGFTLGTWGRNRRERE